MSLYDDEAQEEAVRNDNWHRAAARRLCLECGQRGGHNSGCPAADDNDNEQEASDGN